jgi:hypothetical protein
MYIVFKDGDWGAKARQEEKKSFSMQKYPWYKDI